MKKHKVILGSLIIIALLLIGVGLYFLVFLKENPQSTLYDQEYGCNILKQRQLNLISCDLVETKKEYIILGTKKTKDQYDAFYQLDLSTGEIIELPMVNVQTG